MMDSRAASICLWLALVFPSSFVVTKYLGWECTVAYATVVALIVAFEPPLPERLSSRRLLWLALLTLSIIAVAFLVTYRIANTNAPGTGSDDDDALNIGAAALFRNGLPYSRTTYLGNAIHQLPGALVLAAPFVLLGTSALQNLFWLPLFFLAVREEAGGQTALHLAWLVLLLSPGVMHEVVTGTGYVSNTIYVLLGLWWLVRTRHRDAAAITWGVTLASRANFLLLVPLAFGYLRQTAGSRTALRAMALTCTSAACLIIPFYLRDRHNFGPLESADRLLVFNGLLPHLGLALLILMAALAFGLSSTRMDASALFRNCALVQAWPVVAGVALSIVRDRQLNLWYTRYGAFFAWFLLMALAIKGRSQGWARSSRLNERRDHPVQDVR